MSRETKPKPWTKPWPKPTPPSTERVERGVRPPSADLRAIAAGILDRVKTARLAAGLSQETFAHRIGVDRQRVIMFERPNLIEVRYKDKKGYMPPTATEAVMVAKVTGCDLGWLLTGSGSPPGEQKPE